MFDRTLIGKRGQALRKGFESGLFSASRVAPDPLRCVGGVLVGDMVVALLHEDGADEDFFGHVGEELGDVVTGPGEGLTRREVGPPLASRIKCGCSTLPVVSSRVGRVTSPLRSPTAFSTDATQR